MNIPRKLLALLLCTLSLLPARATPVSGRSEYHTAEAPLPTVPLDIATSAGSAVLLDASGSNLRTLWAQNADKRRGPASTTKVMTALVAAEKMPLSTKITVPKEAVGIEGSSVYLTEGAATVILYVENIFRNAAFSSAAAAMIPSSRAVV